MVYWYLAIVSNLLNIDVFFGQRSDGTTLLATTDYIVLIVLSIVHPVYLVNIDIISRLSVNTKFLEVYWLLIYFLDVQ